MKRWLMIAFVLLLCAPAHAAEWACTSFDDCMSAANDPRRSSGFEGKTAYATQALAFAVRERQ